MDQRRRIVAAVATVAVIAAIGMAGVRITGHAGGDARRHGHREAAKPRFALKPFAAGKGDAAAADILNQKLRTRLEDLSDISLTASETDAEYYVDGSIAGLTSEPIEGDTVRVKCDVSALVAAGAERSIKLMITAGGSVDGPGAAQDIEVSRRYCLADAAKQVAERIEGFVAAR